MPSFTVTIVMFIAVFLALSVGAGLTFGTGTIPDIGATVNAITGPFPTISTSSCSFSAQGPSGQCSIVDSWGLGLIFIFASLGSIFYRVGAVLFLFVQLIQVLTGFTGIPFVGPIFAGFVVLLALVAWSNFRANQPP